MKFSCVLKRFIPFAVALMLGLFITSFFVTIAAPKLRSGNYGKHRHSHRDMKLENQRLRQENEMLRQRLAELEEKRLISEGDQRFVELPVVRPSAPADREKNLK